MNIECHIQDGDSSASKSLLEHFPDCKVMQCGNHVSKSHKVKLTKIMHSKSFTADELASFPKKLPFFDVHDEKCHCTVRHSKMLE